MYDESEVPLDVIVDLVQHIHAYEGDGAILIFLSGWEEISAVSRFRVPPWFCNNWRRPRRAIAGGRGRGREAIKQRSGVCARSMGDVRKVDSIFFLSRITFLISWQFGAFGHT